jgi:DNA-binding MarR family transcriptional regulator
MSTSEDLETEHKVYVALFASARGIDRAHQSGLIARRSGVNLDRSLHHLLATMGRLGSMRISDLAAALALKVSTVSRHVSRLVDAGLVIRNDDPEDGRASFVELSASGRSAYEATRNAWEAIIADALSTLNDARAARFAGDFLAFAHALQALDNEGD